MLHLLYVYAYYHTRNKRTSMRLYCCELSARENRHKISYTHTCRTARHAARNTNTCSSYIHNILCVCILLLGSYRNRIHVMLSEVQCATCMFAAECTATVCVYDMCSSTAAEYFLVTIEKLSKRSNPATKCARTVHELWWKLLYCLCVCNNSMFFFFATFFFILLNIFFFFHFFFFSFLPILLYCRRTNIEHTFG